MMEIVKTLETEIHMTQEQFESLLGINNIKSVELYNGTKERSPDEKSLLWILNYIPKVKLVSRGIIE